MSRVRQELGLTADEVIELLDKGTENLPLMIKLCTILGESLNYIVLGLTKFDAAPVDGHVADAISAAASRAKSKTKQV